MNDDCFVQINYPEFKGRYNILGAAAVAKAKNDKAAAGAVMDIVKLDKEKFRLGHTKVFFRAGIGGWMEEQREFKIGTVLAWLQAGARGKSSRMQFKKLQVIRYAKSHDAARIKKTITSRDNKKTNRVHFFRIRSLPCTLASEPFVGCSLQRPGSGCRSGSW